MRRIMFCALVLAACGGEPTYEMVSVLAPRASPEMLECLAMRTLWQVDCFCWEADACEGRKYACFWDLSHDGLMKNPEMADLYVMFHADLMTCREYAVKPGDIASCEDAALEQALIRCEHRLLGLGG